MAVIDKCHHPSAYKQPSRTECLAPCFLRENAVSPKLVVATPTPMPWTALRPAASMAPPCLGQQARHAASSGFTSPLEPWQVLSQWLWWALVSWWGECRAHRTHVHGTLGATSSVAWVVRLCPQAEVFGHRKRMPRASAWGLQSGYPDKPPAQPQIYPVISYKLILLLSVQLTIFKTGAAIYCPYGAKQSLADTCKTFPGAQMKTSPFCH